MADPATAAADDRWLVIDERRLRYIMFDTRLLADRWCEPVDMVVFAAVAWHTNMRAIEEVELPLGELAAYARSSTRTVQRSLDRICSRDDDGELIAGYVSKRARRGESSLYGLHDHAEFPTPASRTPWSTTAPGLSELEAAVQLAETHRWVTGTAVAGMRHVIEFDTRLLVDTLVDAHAIAAYLGILWHIGYRGAFPRMSRLSTLTRIGETRLRGALDALCAAGYLERTHRQGKTTVFSALPLDRLPVPAGWSPWSKPTPDTAEEVASDQARASSDEARAPHTGSQAGVARAQIGEAPPGTHDRDEGVLSTTPDGGEARSSTAPDRAEGDPGQGRGRSHTPPPTTPPPPSAVPARPDTPQRPLSVQATRSRRARAVRDNPRDPKARAVIQTEAARRALLLVENWRTHIVAGDVDLDMLADRVRADCRRSRHHLAIDVDAVVTTALTAAQVAIDTSSRREISNHPPTTEA